MFCAWSLPIRRVGVLGFFLGAGKTAEVLALKGPWASLAVPIPKALVLCHVGNVPVTRSGGIRGASHQRPWLVFVTKGNVK